MFPPIPSQLSDSPLPSHRAIHPEEFIMSRVWERVHHTHIKGGDNLMHDTVKQNKTRNHDGEPWNNNPLHLLLPPPTLKGQLPKTTSMYREYHTSHQSTVNPMWLRNQPPLWSFQNNKTNTKLSVHHYKPYISFKAKSKQQYPRANGMHFFPWQAARPIPKGNP